MADSFQQDSIYYDLNPSLTLYYSPVFSYSQEAKIPILWTRYAHNQTFSDHHSIKNDKPWCSIFIFFSGNFSFFFNDHMYTPSFGDIFIIRANEKYMSIFPEPSYVDYYEFNFPVEFFEKASDCNLFWELFYGNNRSPLISPGKTITSEIAEHLRRLDNLSISKSEHRDIIMYSHIIQIAEAIRTASAIQPSAVPVSKAPKKLNDAIFYIHNNFTTLEGVSEVANACKVSNTYLSRIFKTHLSCAPNEYITKLRISYAKYLLSEGNSITETCYKSGFNNYTYFISKFKQISGTTPSEFKKHNI